MALQKGQLRHNLWVESENAISWKDGNIHGHGIKASKNLNRLKVVRGGRFAKMLQIMVLTFKDVECWKKTYVEMNDPCHTNIKMKMILKGRRLLYCHYWTTPLTRKVFPLLLFFSCFLATLVLLTGSHPINKVQLCSP